MKEVNEILSAETLSRKCLRMNSAMAFKGTSARRTKDCKSRLSNPSLRVCTSPEHLADILAMFMDVNAGFILVFANFVCRVTAL